MPDELVAEDADLVRDDKGLLDKASRFIRRGLAPDATPAEISTRVKGGPDEYAYLRPTGLRADADI